MKTIIAMVTLVLLYTTTGFAQKSGYTISGNIKGLPDGITFYLIQAKESGGADTVARVKSKNNNFLFKGKLEEDGQLTFVKMDTSIVKLNDRQTWIRLLLENSEKVIKLKGDIKDWPEIEIEGSELTKEHNQFASSIVGAMELFNQKLKEAQRDSGKITEANTVFDHTYLKNLELISGSYAVPLFLFNYKKLDVSLKDAEYQKLSTKQKNSYYGKKLNQEIIGIKVSKNIRIGKVIPDFHIKTPEGKLESVRSLAQKSKYTLVDFWASWCAPCRADIPNMKKVYNDFKDKGFNILSISTDTSPQSWMKALKEENTSWVNTVQQNRESDRIFGIIAIPAYILLNDKAEIVQMDMTSRFFGAQGTATMGGTIVYVKDAKTKGLRGDDLYQVIEGLLGKPEVKK